MSSRLEPLPPKERRGSRARCILLTDGSRHEVACRLTALVEPYAVVDAQRHVWAPRGISDPAEAQLGKTAPFLSARGREAISNWWLAVRLPRTNTPNWDIVSQTTIAGAEGLLLVEAKAHDAELKKEEAGKRLMANASPDSHRNHQRIGTSIAEASRGLAAATGLTWQLSRDSHYQMSNRFAWAWKLAQMKVPVILVYLGFLKADEMQDQGAPLTTQQSWKGLVRSHSRALVPGLAWEKTWNVSGTPMTPLIRSVVQSLA